MNDKSCLTFLQWALPLLHMRWAGFRKVRGQVCKRLGRRLEELQLPDLHSYRLYLQDNPLEWHILDTMCRITISRFYRDRGLYRSLQLQVFPELLYNSRQQGGTMLSCWCIGAASGEEPYSLNLLWELAGLDNQGADLNILATEVDQRLIDRARQGCYPASSINELPAGMKDQAFVRQGNQFCLKKQYRERVQFRQQDIRNMMPDATFHLILCRNLVFTYFSLELQEELARRLVKHLKADGLLVIGIHESLPAVITGLEPLLSEKSIYRRIE